MFMRTSFASIGISLATPGLAWEDFGHMEVAHTAWDLLSPSARARAAQLIRLPGAGDT
jgi:hypothetical protein